MKSTHILFLLLFICIADSCDIFNPEPEPSEKPKASGLYECFINGEHFIANGPAFENQFGDNPKTRLTEIAGDFQYSISNRDEEQWLKIKSIIENKVGSYDLKEGLFTDFSKNECNEYLIYDLIPDTTNYLNVTFVDLVHEYITAEFECYLVNECINDTLHILGHLERDYVP